MRGRVAHGARLALTALLLTTASGCASLAKPSPVSLGMAQVMNDRRATVTSAAALTEIRIDGLEKLQAPFPATFTATLRHTAPDQFEVDAYGPMGLLLFSYSTTADSWLLRSPGQPPAGGPLAANGRAPATLLLDTLAHLLDGVLGVPLHGAPPRRTKDGGWRTARDGVRFHMVDGNLARIAFKRHGVGKVAIAYSDYRPVAGTTFPREAPHAIVLTVPRHQVTMTVQVAEWAVQSAPAGYFAP
ncbi:MAG: hypothetical protein OEY97_01875 [Nitrospirota bacterium]|nr:hypothetical protein [Nitrospirota bacterium]